MNTIRTITGGNAIGRTPCTDSKSRSIRASFPLCAIALSSFLWASSAGAALITQTHLFGTSGSPNSFAEPMTTATFNLFDFTLGTLDSLTIELDATVTGATTLQKPARVDNFTPVGSVTRKLTLDLSSISGLSDLTVSSIDPWSQTLTGASTKTQLVNHFRSSDVTTTNAAILALFTGAGTRSFDLDGLITDTFTRTNFTVNSLTAFAQGGITLTYDYTIAQAPPPPPNAVPTPGTLALLGAGLLGCVLMRRRSPAVRAVAAAA